MNHIRPSVLLALVTILALTVSLFDVQAAVTTVSHWRMGEDDPSAAPGPATTTTDPTGQRAMSLLGAPVYSTNVSSAAAGMIGSSRSIQFFSGTYGTNALIPSLTDNFGLELWVNPQDTTGNKCLAYNGDVGTSGWGLYQMGSTYQVSFGGVTYIGSGAAISGTWTHLAMVRNNGITTLYVNGVASGSNASAPNTAAGIFAVASSPASVAGDQFAGFLDEVRVFTFLPGEFSTGDLLFSFPPTVTTLAATSVGGASVTLNGQVNPNDRVTAAYFEYATDPNFDIPTIANPSFELNNYTVFPGYASGNGGVITGWDMSNASRIGLNPAGSSPFADNGAIPHGSKVAFIQSVGSANTLSTVISNLVVGRTYQVSFRANCRSGYGPLTSTWSLNGESFVPFTASPSVGGANPYYFNSNTFTATTNTAALALRNFSAADTTVLVDNFSITGDFGVSATNNLAATNSVLAVSTVVSGLQPFTTYYFRIVGSNSAGQASGSIQTFTTPIVAPTVSTLAATGVTTTNAMLHATVNPGASATTAYFEYGTSTNYGSFSVTNSLAGTNAAFAISNLVSGLAPETIYHFRIKAENSAGTNWGTSQTFTTVRSPIVANITNSADSGAGTLRQAILDSVTGDTILFDASLSGSTILLTSGQLVLTNNLSIDASTLPDGLQLDGNGTGRIFQVNNGATVVLTTLTLTNGGAVTSGGAILNAGNLTLDRCTIVGNSVTGSTGNTGNTGSFGSTGGTGGTGGLGAGGGIYNSGTLTVNQCTVTANHARGGNGGQGGRGGDDAGRGGSGGSGGTGTGGGIYNSGAAAINQCTIALNSTSGGSGGAGGPGGPGPWGIIGPTGFSGGPGSGTAGGINQSSGSLNLFNSIVANNTPNNLIGTVTQTGNNLTNGDPILAALGNNGGPTLTMALSPGSPAFNAGAPTVFGIDQRGFPRVMGGAPDIGAVEMPAPSVVTLPASDVSHITATVNGTVDPNGEPASIYFQYGTSTNYGSFTSTNTSATNVVLEVPKSLVNLQPATTYHFRIVADNGIGKTVGADLTFTTTAAAPTVTTLAATDVTTTTATLRGTVNPNGLETETYFEYGTTSGYGSFGATSLLEATNTAITVNHDLDNLLPGTVYHYRVVAINSAGRTDGPDFTIRANPLPPVATTLAATEISGISAVLNASVNTGNGDTIAYFSYSTDPIPNPYTNATIANPSFELDNYTVYPGYASVNGGVITGWDISNTSRIGLNPASSSPFADNGAIPAGTRVAFIQSNQDTNTLSTTITDLAMGRTYLVRFRANCRTGLVPSPTWSLNGGAYVPFTASPAVGGTNPYYTNSATFIATNTSAVLALRNYTSHDSTVLIDDFSIVINPDVRISTTNSLPTTAENVQVATVVTGLQPFTTYYFHVVAVNNVGSSTGSTLEFTTGEGPPTVMTSAATDIDMKNARLNGTVNPNGTLTVAYFEYGASTNYGSFSMTNQLVTSHAVLDVSELVGNLLPNTQYHFRMVAENEANTAVGSNLTFTTSAAAPTITPLEATILSTNAATGLVSVQLAAIVQPNGSATTGHFEYGLTSGYGGTNAFSTVASNIVITNVTTIISFSAGFSYHWRLVAENSVGTRTTSDQTFNLGNLNNPSDLPGDLNGDGVISQEELDTIYGHYLTNSPWLFMTNVAGLGGTNVSFALDNAVAGAYMVEFSTNLVEWYPLGPASPRYLFVDTNAPASPQRHYRLRYP